MWLGTVAAELDSNGSPHLAVRAHDKRIACEEEFSDSEDEGQGGRRNAANFKKAKRVKTEEEKDGEEKKGEPTNITIHLTKPQQQEI